MLNMQIFVFWGLYYLPYG